MMGWISVKDRLSKRDGSYIVHSSKSGSVFVAQFSWLTSGQVIAAGAKNLTTSTSPTGCPCRSRQRNTESGGQI